MDVDQSVSRARRNILKANWTERHSDNSALLRFVQNFKMRNLVQVFKIISFHGNFVFYIFLLE